MRKRILRWLGGVPLKEFHALREMHDDLVRQVGLQQREAKAILSDLASEFNALRNNLPAVLTEPAPTVRRMRNWRETVAAIEGRPLPGSPQPIHIERSA